jgi:hypothetical protein
MITFKVYQRNTEQSGCGKLIDNREGAIDEMQQIP